MRKLILLLVVLFSGCSDKFITTVKTQTLQVDWQFSQNGKNKWLPAAVPGTIHADLLKNNIIEDPLFDNNELKLQWIGETDWIYKTTFVVTDSLLKFKAIDIIFDGLDTYSKVYINDSLLFSADNMFCQWNSDAKKLLHIGENTIRVNFYSPALAGKLDLDNYQTQLPANDPISPKISPFIRKAPYHFGWDWSPRFLTMGIWKPITIKAHDKVYITNIHVRTIEIADTCAWLSADITISSSVNLPNSVITVRDGFKQFKIRKGETKAEVQFKILNPELWWPNGIGKQTLYDLTAKLFVNGYLVDSIVSRTGIRTIELHQDEDEWGKGFYFRINGLPVFMKGANYVPQSNFVTNVTHENYDRLLNDVSSVGMNMLRVWGGGIYEDDYFYNLCDEKGILIWQDFMFANAMYPGNETFRENVKKEIDYQVKRLRNHPSIALWCGNNEINVAWNNWGWQKELKMSSTDSVKIKSNYNYLFEKLIPETLSKLDPSRPYISTSPLSNWGKRENFNQGNMHYWGVWHGEEPIDSFRTNVPRFMTEYGMQSYPSFSALKKNTDSTRITLNSEFIRNRQRSYKGNKLLINYIENHFGKVKNTEDLCYFSQLNQAAAMKIAIESHRKDARFCMGSLYWQLNDVWDGASWSTIEHNGKWKAAHYAMKRLYAGSILIVETINDTSRIYLQTENTYGQTGILTVEVMDFKGRVVGKYSDAVSAGYLVSEKIFEIAVHEVLDNKPRKDFLVKASLVNNDVTIAETIHYFVKPNELKLLKPNLKYEIKPSANGAIINLTTDVLVKGLLLEFTNTTGIFSDNYFDLLPGEQKLVIFNSGEPLENDAGLKLKWFEQ